MTMEDRLNDTTRDMHAAIDNLNMAFKKLTIGLMACKYAYYIECRPLISDYNYDMREHDWYRIGLTMGYLKEGEISPCIGFDEKHSDAQAGKDLALKYLNKGEV